MREKITLSVAIITYNHAEFVRETLDAVLSQDVDFDYEVVVGDDSSTDGTQHILLEYEKKHSERLRIIYRKKNMGATKNLHDIFMNCKGRYIAIVEGDDFWTDDKKLQKQVDFLEKNTEFSGIAHSCSILYSGIDHHDWYEKIYRHKENFIFTHNMFLKRRLAGQTGTMLFRNIFKEDNFDTSMLYNAHRMVGDESLTLLLLAKGNIFCMKDEMSCYRLVVKNGSGNYLSQKLGKKFLKDAWFRDRYLDKFSKEHFGISSITSEKRASYIIAPLVQVIKYKRMEFITSLLYHSAINIYRPKVYISLFNALTDRYRKSNN